MQVHKSHLNRMKNIIKINIDQKLGMNNKELLWIKKA